MQLADVGLPGHYVVAHFGGIEPLLLDPFSGGVRKSLALSWGASVVPARGPAMRMLDDLVPAFRRRVVLARALRAAEMRLAVPADTDQDNRLRASASCALRAGLN